VSSNEKNNEQPNLTVAENYHYQKERREAVTTAPATEKTFVWSTPLDEVSELSVTVTDPTEVTVTLTPSWSEARVSKDVNSPSETSSTLDANEEASLTSAKLATKPIEKETLSRRRRTNVPSLLPLHVKSPMLATATSTPLLLSASIRTNHVVPLSPRFSSEQTMFLSSSVQDIVMEPCAVAVATIVVVSDDVEAIVVEKVIVGVSVVFSSNTDDCATAEVFPLFVSEEVDVLPLVVVMVVFSSNTDDCATTELFPLFVSEEVDVVPTVVVMWVVFSSNTDGCATSEEFELFVSEELDIVPTVVVVVVVLSVVVSVVLSVVSVVSVVLSVELEDPKVDLMAVTNNTNLIMFVISERSGCGPVTR